MKMEVNKKDIPTPTSFDVVWHEKLKKLDGFNIMLWRINQTFRPNQKWDHRLQERRKKSPNYLLFLSKPTVWQM